MIGLYGLTGLFQPKQFCDTTEVDSNELIQLANMMFWDIDADEKDPQESWQFLKEITLRVWAIHAEEVRGTAQDQPGCRKLFVNLRWEWSMQQREAGSDYLGELQKCSPIVQGWNQKMKAAISKGYQE